MRQTALQLALGAAIARSAGPSLAAPALFRPWRAFCRQRSARETVFIVTSQRVILLTGRGRRVAETGQSFGPPLPTEDGWGQGRPSSPTGRNFEPRRPTFIGTLPASCLHGAARRLPAERSPPGRGRPSRDGVYACRIGGIGLGVPVTASAANSGAAVLATATRCGRYATESPPRGAATMLQMRTATCAPR